MKITIVIPESLWGKDLEITLQSEAHIEGVIGETYRDEFERENAAAEVRLKSLDDLEPYCNWSSASPTIEELQARERWQWLMDQQSVFETKYNL
jgi:hypothetical protein